MLVRIKNPLFKDDLYDSRLQHHIFETTPHTFKGHVWITCVSNPNIFVGAPVHLGDLQLC